MKEINSERQALNEAFENVDDRFIEKTKDAPRVRKWGSFSPRAVIAACLAIVESARTGVPVTPNYEF